MDKVRVEFELCKNGFKVVGDTGNCKNCKETTPISLKSNLCGIASSMHRVLNFSKIADQAQFINRQNDEKKFPCGLTSQKIASEVSAILWEE